MVSLEQINEEVQQEAKTSGPQAIDIVRRKKLQKLSSLTNRPSILYAVDMFNNQKVIAAQGEVALGLSDKDGFIEAFRNIKGQDVDIILHSPGGSPEATESIVDLIRRRFTHVRFVIPNVAKSAATMLAMSGNEIILGRDAELGPTDPQMVINGKVSPAFAILRQFDIAKNDLSKNNTNLPAWLPILQQYGPSLITQCDDAIKLSKRLVTDWLAAYMFNGQKNAKKRSAIISRYLANKKHLSHSRPISIEYLRSKDIAIKFPDELKPDLTSAIDEIHLAVNLTFMSTGAYKIFENNLGKGLYKVLEQVIIQTPQFPQAKST